MMKCSKWKKLGSSNSGEASQVSNDWEGDNNGQEKIAQQVQAKHSENGTSDSRQASSANDQHESENIDRGNTGNTAQQVQEVKQGVNSTSDSERSSSINNLADNCANSDFSHKGIAFVK